MKKLDLNDLKNLKDNTIVALGFFDGIHLAHQKILNTLCDIANNKNYKSVVITFDDSILSLFKITDYIFPINEKLIQLEHFPIDYVLVLKDSDNFMDLQANEFVDIYLNSINCKEVVCGSDFTFGKNKSGNADYLKEHTSIKVNEVEDIYDKDIKISSSYIRNLLRFGNISKANELLIEPFYLKSHIIEGNKIGRLIGYKTANLKVFNNASLLKKGAYLGKAYYKNKVYDCLVNVGINPTIETSDNLKVEAHILKFNQDIYGKDLKISFIKYIRDEVKFNDIIQLKNQIKKDIETIKIEIKN